LIGICSLRSQDIRDYPLAVALDYFSGLDMGYSHRAQISAHRQAFVEKR